MVGGLAICLYSYFLFNIICLAWLAVCLFVCLFASYFSTFSFEYHLSSQCSGGGWVGCLLVYLSVCFLLSFEYGCVQVVGGLARYAEERR